MIANAIPFNVPPDVIEQLKTPEMWEELIALGIEEQLKPEAFRLMPPEVQEAYSKGKTLYEERQKNATPSKDNPEGLQRLIDRYGPNYPRESAMKADLKRKHLEYQETGVWPTWPMGGKTYGTVESTPPPNETPQ